MSEPVRPAIVIGTINFDCRDPEELAGFYARLLGWQVKRRDHDFVLLGNPSGGLDLSFQEYEEYEPPVWPEETGKQWKMVHLDLQVDDVDAAAAFAIECGARLADYQGRDDLRVMLDPAGHPFCLGRE